MDLSLMIEPIRIKEVELTLTKWQISIEHHDHRSKITLSLMSRHENFNFDISFAVEQWENSHVN